MKDKTKFKNFRDTPVRKSGHHTKQPEIKLFRTCVAGLLCIGLGIIFGYYSEPDPKISRLVFTSVVAGVGGTIILTYHSYLKSDKPIFGGKPLKEISFTKRLFGLMGLTTVACIASGLLTGFFFESVGVGMALFFGVFFGAIGSGVFCAWCDLWNRIFPKKPSPFLHRID